MVSFRSGGESAPGIDVNFGEVKHLVWTGAGTAYSCCLRSVLGLGGEEGRVDTDSDRWRPAPRKLFSLVENAKQDSHGVSLLRTKTQVL